MPCAILIHLLLLPAVVLAQEVDIRIDAEEEDRLALTPRNPHPGEIVVVVYQPIEALDGFTELHLRARLRTSMDDAYNDGMGSSVIAVLTRDDDGALAGSFILPDDVVYAALAVEDTVATVVDSREGKFWNVFISDEDGRPTSEALEQLLNDHMGRDMRVVYETAVRKTELYPDIPGSWTSLAFAERVHLGEAVSNQLREGHLERLRGMSARLENEQELKADVVGWMFWYALTQGDEELRDHWRDRLHAEHPGHFFAIQDRFGEQYREHHEDPQTLLAHLEALWEESDDERGKSRLARPGFFAARETGDLDTILLWADRLFTIDASAEFYLAGLLASDSTTAATGEARLRNLAAEIEQAADELRPLGMTAEGHEQRSLRRAAAIRTDLAEMLNDAGRHQEAIDELGGVMEIGWDPNRYRLMTEALLAAGDTDAAAGHLAHLAADPGADQAEVDSLRQVAGVDGERWDELVSDATRSMHERTLSQARMTSIGTLPFRLADGSTAESDGILGDLATVVVSWSRYCGHSVQAMPNVARFTEDAPASVKVIAVTTDEPEEAEAHVREQGWDLPRYYDQGGAVMRALNSWGTPQYFVLDGGGNLRFSFSGLTDLPRQIAALEAESAAE